MLKRKKEIIAKVMATTMLASTLTSTFTTNVSAAEPQTKATVSETTIAGDDRYKTAVEISKNYSSTSKHAVIVNGQKGIVDALTATPYASLKKAPILMTQSTKLNADTKKELTRRGVKTVDIVGGVNSVSDAVKAEIEAMGIKVNRIAGDSKYDTALEVAKKIDGISNISKIAVANGEVLADAVSVAAPAAQNKMPIILAHPTKGLDAEVKKYIDGEGISTSYVIGGTSSVSTTTQNSLPGTKKRLEGTDRQGTNASVIKEFYTSSSYDNMYVAKSGQVNKADEIADALAVGVLAASNQDPVMLVGKSLGSTQKTLLESKDLEKITKVGGNIPTASIDAIKNTQSSTKTVTTVAELKTALANAKDGDIINFNPSGTVSEAVSLSTTKNVTVNLNGTHSGAVSVDMANGTLNINGNVSNKVSVDAVKAINVKSGVTVKHLEIKSGAKNASIANSGTVTTFDVLATGVKINNTGKIDVLNQLGDTVVEGNGTVGNIDTTKPVSQVNVQNAKELVVRFSQPVDSIPSVTISGGTGSTQIQGTHTSHGTCAVSPLNPIVELSENRTTMTITAPINHYFNGTYALQINGMTSNGTALTPYRTTVVAEDKVGPTVSGVEYNQSEDKIEISLSEPIDSLTGLVLRVGGVPASEDPISAPTKKITLTRPSGTALNTSVDVYVAGLKDAAGNVMTSYSGKVNTKSDTLAISSFTQINNKQMKLVFNKKLNGSPSSGSEQDLLKGTGIALYKKNGSTVSAIAETITIAKDNTDSTGRTYIITCNNILPADKDSQTVTLKISKYGPSGSEVTYEDITGTHIKDGTVEDLILNKDKIAPTVKSAVVSIDRKSIELTMSEDVNIESAPVGSGENNNNNVKLRFNGVDLSKATIEYKTDRYDQDIKNVLLVKTTTEDALESDGTFKAGNYQVYLAGGTVKDLNDIELVSVGIKDIIIPELPKSAKDLGTISTTAENTFTIPAPANEEFTVGSLSSAVIKIDGTQITKYDISFTSLSRNEIKVELPNTDSVKLSGTAEIEVSGLELKSGYPLNVKKDTITLTDNTAPTLTSAKVEISNNTTTTKKARITLTFDENMSNITNDTTIASIMDELIIKRVTGNTEVVYNGGKKEMSDSYDDLATYSVNGKELIITITQTNAQKSNLLEVLAATSYGTNITITVKTPTTANIKDTNNVNARVDETVTTSSVAADLTK